MTRCFIAGIILLLTCVGMLLADEKELKELEGTYTVVSLEKGTKVAGKELTEKMKVRFKGDSLTIMIKSDEKTSTIKTDATQSPHTIDISPNEGKEKGKTFPGIYKLEKDELTIAYAMTGERPKEFSSENDITLWKLKKEANK
jgi:uncharacterized protein (TIGR03067 family)